METRLTEEELIFLKGFLLTFVYSTTDSNSYTDDPLTFRDKIRVLPQIVEIILKYFSD